MHLKSLRPTLQVFTLLFLLLFVTFSSFAQDEEEDKKKKSGKKMNIGERLGKFAGDMLTSKTAELEVAVAKPIYYCGVFPMSVGTTAAKLMPDNTVEGDHIISISFFKNEGAGLFKIKGDVLLNGEPMEYVGVGSYLAKSSEPFVNPKIEIKTETGDHAALVVKAIPEIKLLKVNGEGSLPVLDVSEDLEIEIFNPEGAENTRIKVSLLADIMGVRSFNHFADFESGPAGVRKIKIPKQALANPEVAGQMGAGNYNKGENLLLIERMLVTENDKLGAEQDKGQLHSAELLSVSCASMPVIVKGRQEGGLNLSLKVTGTTGSAGFDFYKPNATTGIPLSQASTFGLTSFTLDGKTFREDVFSSSSTGYGIGGTTVTRTTVTTYTYEFPQLPDDYWDYVMEVFYSSLTKMFKDKYKVNFVPVESVTATPQYSTLFKTEVANTKYVIKKSYKNTLRSSPKSLAEILGNVSSNNTSNVPIVNMMKEINVDGLLSMSLKLTVGGNADKKVVLSPELWISVIGRDENNNNKQGTYLIGIIRAPGTPFNTDMVKKDKQALVNACSIPQVIEALDKALSTMKTKEGEFGYDAIWSIGK
jgi:hypothetical protein